MITASLNSSDLADLEGKGPLILNAVRIKMNSLLIQLQAKIVGEKLQGQVLQHRTGNLQRSIVLSPASGAVIVGNEVIGSVIGATPPAQYGMVHEYGGESSYDITANGAKALRWFAEGGAKRFAKTVQHPQMPERSFMRSSLEEMRATIVQQIQGAVVEVMKQ